MKNIMFFVAFVLLSNSVAAKSDRQKKDEEMEIKACEQALVSLGHEEIAKGYSKWAQQQFGASSCRGYVSEKTGDRKLVEKIDGIVWDFKLELIKIEEAKEQAYAEEQRQKHVKSLIEQCNKDLIKQTSEFLNVKYTYFTGTMSQVDLGDLILQEFVCKMDKTGDVTVSTDFFGDGFTIIYKKPDFEIELYFDQPNSADYHILTEVNGNKVNFQQVADLYPKLLAIIQNPPLQ